MSRKRRHRRGSGKGKMTSGRPAGGPRLVTPEGDPIVFASALYEHNALAKIRERLAEAEDFDWVEELEPGAVGSFQVSWLGMEPGSVPAPDPLSRRFLATLTVTATTLEIETISRERLRACQKRLGALFGSRIHHTGTTTKTPEQVLREPAPPDEAEPFIPPPEMIAELEERMIRQWLDESIPALGGLTPREAAKTPEGRERLLDLLDYMARNQAVEEMPPGMFSPDYRKAKKMLGLE